MVIHESMRGVVVAKLTSRTEKPPETQVPERFEFHAQPLIGKKIVSDQSEAGKSKCFWNCFGKGKFSRGSPVPYMIYACSYFVREYFMSRSPRMAIIKAILRLQTSASLSLCTPAKSKASFKKPCLSVRNIDPITASASCHTRFQFLW